MKDTAIRSATDKFEEALTKLDQETYVLRLYVAGMTPKSMLAVENTKRICEEHLSGRYRLEVVDIYQQPVFARDGQIVAAPTLIKERPPPMKKIIGNMANVERVLVGMDLRSNG